MGHILHSSLLLTVPRLTSYPTFMLLVTICSVGPNPLPVGSEGAGFNYGLFIIQESKGSTVIQGLSETSHPGLGVWYPKQTTLPSARVSPFTHQKKAHSRQYPPGHQLLSIVTAGRSGKAQESRGKSGVVKGKTGEIVRRNCG